MSSGRFPVAATAGVNLVYGGTYFCNATGGAFIAVLPDPAPGLDTIIVIKTDSSANAITIIGTVSGVVNPTLTAQYNSMTVTCDGTSWFKVAST